jgi:hypothetical protein
MVTRMAVGVPLALALSSYRFAKLRQAEPRVLALAPLAGYGPLMLEGESWNDGGLTSVTLSYGRPLDVATPLAVVTTCLDGAGGLASRQVDLLQRERGDAAIGRHDWEGMDGGLPFQAGDDDDAAELAVSAADLEVLVAGERQAVSALRYRHYTALRFGCDGLTIQVVSRHELPEPLCFEFATDLEPYFRGYRRFVLSWLTFSPPASTTG